MIVHNDTCVKDYSFIISPSVHNDTYVKHYITSTRGWAMHLEELWTSNYVITVLSTSSLRKRS